MYCTKFIFKCSKFKNRFDKIVILQDEPPNQHLPYEPNVNSGLFIVAVITRYWGYYRKEINISLLKRSSGARRK